MAVAPEAPSQAAGPSGGRRGPRAPPVVRGRSRPPELRRDEHGTPEVARAQRRRAGGHLGWQFRAEPPGAGRSCLPYLGREGPQFRAIPGGPGDSEPGRSSSRGLPEGAGSAETWTAGGQPGARPKLPHNAPRYVKPRGRAAGAAEGQVGEWPFSDSADCKGRDRGGGRGPCRSGWPVPRQGTDALDAAWGGRSRRQGRSQGFRPLRAGAQGRSPGSAGLGRSWGPGGGGDLDWVVGRERGSGRGERRTRRQVGPSAPPGAPAI